MIITGRIRSPLGHSRFIILSRRIRLLVTVATVFALEYSHEQKLLAEFPRIEHVGIFLSFVSSRFLEFVDKQFSICTKQAYHRPQRRYKYETRVRYVLYFAVLYSRWRSQFAVI